MSIVDNNINKIDEFGDLLIKKYIIPTIKGVGFCVRKLSNIH